MKRTDECGCDAPSLAPQMEPHDFAHERIPGGEAEARDPGEFDQEELLLGIADELEHTDDIVTAMEIAMDHLTQNPKYYSRPRRIVGISLGEVFKLSESDDDDDRGMPADPFAPKAATKPKADTGGVGDLSPVARAKPKMAPPTPGKTPQQSVAQGGSGNINWSKGGGQKPMFQGSFVGQVADMGKRRVSKKVAWQDRATGQWRGGSVKGWGDANMWVWDGKSWVRPAAFEAQYGKLPKPETESAMPKLSEVFSIDETFKQGDFVTLIHDPETRFRVTGDTKTTPRGLKKWKLVQVPPREMLTYPSGRPWIKAGHTQGGEYGTTWVPEDQLKLTEVFTSQRQAHKIDGDEELDPLGTGTQQPKRNIRFGKSSMRSSNVGV